jgi:hypothetical protein
MTILYQNNVTGDAWDVTTLCKAAKLTTKRRGSPGAFEGSFLEDENVVWTHGGILVVKDDDNVGKFYGYVFKTSITQSGTTDITAYDQLRYLKSKETYVFTGKRADQIIQQIADDFGIKTGTLANTGYAIPSLVEDAKTLFDIALDALDYTLINSGKMFFLWDDFGSLTLSDVEKCKLDLFLGDESLATSYTFTSDIDSETYNKIKLAKDNKTTGKRDIYIFQDSGNMKLWGVLQDYETVDDDMNEAQIKARGDQMLELYNRPKKSFKITAIADLSVRAGYAVYIGIKKIGVSAFYIVEECSQDLLKQTMTLTLKVV